MNLKITNCNNFFKIKGILNRRNVHLFQEEFRNIFDRVNKLTISIEELEDIDRYGINAIAKLHNESITMEKNLSIIGYGHRGLYHHLKSSNVA